MRVPAGAYGELVGDLLATGKPVTTRVCGGSMQPAIPDGAVIRVVPARADELHVGEVVMVVNTCGKPVCHRLARKLRRDGQLLLQTRGDMTAKPDRPVPVSHLLGRVSAIQKDGAWQDLQPDNVRARRRLLLRRLRRLLGAIRRRVSNALACGAASPGESR